MPSSGLRRHCIHEYIDIQRQGLRFRDKSYEMQGGRKCLLFVPNPDMQDPTALWSNIYEGDSLISPRFIKKWSGFLPHNSLDLRPPDIPRDVW